MSKFAFLTLLLNVFLTFSLFGQNGRQPTPVTESPTVEKKSDKKPADLEKFVFITADSFERFAQDLNRLGKSGYKLEKAANFGGLGTAQKFSAVLRLDEEASYQYEWLASPNRDFIEPRLNAKARQGFEFVNIFQLTFCGEDGTKTDTKPDILSVDILNFTKGDAFLLVKEINRTSPVKEYKVINAKIGLGKNPTAELQKSLDNLPEGFHAVKVLFNKSGFANFSVSILLEKDLLEKEPIKVEYKFVKEVNGFEKELNTLAAQGFRFVSGRRIGLVRMALMGKISTEKVVYSLIDAEKFEKEFEKSVSAGNRFEGIMTGDISCDSGARENEKLLFVSRAETDKPVYQILKINDAKAFEPNGETSLKIKAFLADGFGVKNLFYQNGLHIIFEK